MNGPISHEIGLVRDIMDVLVACKYEEDPKIKNEVAIDWTTFSPL